MSPAERLKVLLFLALFFGAVGFLFTLLSCGTEYWLLAAESCSRSEDRNGVSGLREGRSKDILTETSSLYELTVHISCSKEQLKDKMTMKQNVNMVIHNT